MRTPLASAFYLSRILSQRQEEEEEKGRAPATLPRQQTQPPSDIPLKRKILLRCPLPPPRQHGQPRQRHQRTPNLAAQTSEYAWWSKTKTTTRKYLVELLEQKTFPRARCPREEDGLAVQHQVDHVPLLRAQPLWIDRRGVGRQA